MTELRSLERPAAGEPEGALVLLHGRGADEHDLFGLLDVLDPERRLLGLTPRGPLALPPGGAHWYRLAGIPTPDPETFWASVALLATFLDGLPFGPERVVLGGFSQGAVMSYALALGPGRPRPAGLVALSGFLPRVEGYPLGPERLAGVPVAIAHGSLDPVIPVAFGREARETLAAAGAEPRYHEGPFGHSVDPRSVPVVRAVVQAAVGARPHLSR